MKKIIFRFLSLLIILAIFPPLDVLCANVDLSAKSAVLLEADDGVVLYRKNAHIRLPMASTTKIMTALVAIELGELDKPCKINKNACGIEGSSIYMSEGEELTLRSLLYALMLASANDAAAAIAYEIGGSIEEFARLMNKKAKSLGLKDTHFENPHGLDGKEHYTTAYDLAKITAAAMKNDTFREICSSKSAAIPMSDGGKRYLTNHNKLLRLYDGAVGVKTGFTKKSGRCLVSAAERDGLTLIAVTLNAPDDWNDHKELLDFGFSNYERCAIAKKGEFIAELQVCGGALPTVVVANQRDLSAFYPKGESKLTYKIEANRPIYAPVAKNTVLGCVKYYYGGRLVAESPLIAVTSVQVSGDGHNLFLRLKNLIFR